MIPTSELSAESIHPTTPDRKLRWFSVPKPIKATRPGRLRKYQRQREWEESRDKFKRENQNPNGTWHCHHCPFPILTWGEAVVDHFPFTKGNRPDLLCDPKDFVMSHAACNTSGNPHRRNSFKNISEFKGLLL